MALSQNSISLQPNQQGSVHIQFVPYRSINLSAYLIPINVSVSGANSTASGLLYAIMVPKRTGSALSVFSRVTLLNGSRNSNTQLTVLNPTGAANYGLSLSTSLNSSLTGSSNNIVPGGPTATTSSKKGAYTLNWYLGTLLGHNSTQLSYNVSNVISPRYLLIPSLFLSSTTQSNLTALSILKITVPQQSYTNNTYNITVSAIYTGTNATAINFTLTSTSGGKVLNPRQSFTVTPYSTIFASFLVSTGPYPENETFNLNAPGISTVPTQYIMLRVNLPPIKVPTIYDYINDPRTIFGVLTFAVSAAAVLGGRISRMSKDRALRKRMTVKSLDALPKLDKKINMAILDADGRKRTFKRQVNKDGSLGGFVEDSAMVGGDVVVAQAAIVEGSAIISGSARILDGARVSNHAVIRGDVAVSGNARVGDNAELYGDAALSGNAKAFGQCEIYDNARIYGDAEVFGNAHVYGEAQVFGKAKVYGISQVSGIAKISKANVSKGDIVSGTR
jgi:carbonic anhydrase/acetyltransferase-like protein (isoleucine patch superfamily)